MDGLSRPSHGIWLMANHYNTDCRQNPIHRPMSKSIADLYITVFPYPKLEASYYGYITVTSLCLPIFPPEMCSAMDVTLKRTGRGQQLTTQVNT